MTTPAERQFVIYRRGEVREQILVGFRDGLRALVDPETQQPFTEDKIRLATSDGTRFYVEADAIDVVGLGIQKRDEFFVQQIRIDRAGTAFLRDYHGELWGLDPLPAAGGFGTINAKGVAGTTFLGSTTVPDSLAHYLTDEAGQRFQVFVGGTVPASSDTVALTVIGVDAGDSTNLEIGDELTWGNPPAGAQPTALVATDFTGGVDAETDGDYADRMAADARHKPAAGNWAHLRQWARRSTNSVENAFIYPCALHAGSVLICVTQKRGTTTGPLGRIPNLATLVLATSYLVPPGSPVVPPRAFVVVTGPSALPTNMVHQLALPKNSAAGWVDLEPFPPAGAATTEECYISTVTTQQNFEITTTAGAGQLPGAVSGPLAGVNLMAWNYLESRFESLDVNTVEDLGAGVYRVLLNSAPSYTIAVNDWISPDMARRDSLAEAIEEYFDSLGPGELIDLTADVRGSRAYRNPVPNEESPFRAGQAVETYISDGIGAPLADALLLKNTNPTPGLPSSVITGPVMVTCGKQAVYAL